jgi:hypothetical protein
MEDRLHIHRIQAKQWPNDRQYLIQLGTHGLPKYDRDRGWQSVNVNRYLWPRGGGWSPNQFPKTERIAGTNGIPSSAAGRARQLFLTYILIRFLYTHSRAYILLWPDIANIQIYIEIWHISHWKLDKFKHCWNKSFPDSSDTSVSAISEIVNFPTRYDWSKIRGPVQ